MARVKRVDNSRKEHVCGRGQHVIPKGEPYLTASPGYRGKPKYRCVQHPFRPSELTTSAASEPMAAVEAFEDSANAGFDTHEDLESAWDELRSAVEEYQQMREGALEAWENGNSQFEEYVETANAAMDEVEGFTLEEFPDEEPDQTDAEAWQEWDDARATHLQDQTEEALAVAGSLEF
ncbi:hypothetical protein PBI_SMARTIES_88 [Microbacterium phage Smarties]|uniref:Uncharacterized protein n=1 Tax=Microbacterium phage Ariadne TaxID=2656546 RepID=A0A649VAV6_9CAUD|nr:hypothetical protein QDA10_gp088 [Microbacterium phage Ariadne]QGJ89491.1 hypothetical protein PBI_ARIADNE_88 [Microbacterium phage Ariadne]QGJ91478.1 hypothetical protein PBI_SMARTIES_88 [Microbacterium phage Smarties]